jgi:hypothetical protein
MDFGITANKPDALRRAQIGRSLYVSRDVPVAELSHPYLSAQTAYLQPKPFRDKMAGNQKCG